MLEAQIRARTRVVSGTSETVAEDWIDAMDTMAAAAREEYRDLLETEEFVSYFRQTTPIGVIEDLNLGSRPASRSDGVDVADLRAIPWVFAWTQARCILPGWYSLATGIEAYLDEGGDMALLREMYDEWPFFETMLDSAAGALGRTELGIATEYAQLADPPIRERFEPRIRAEYEDAVRLVTTIARRDHPIDREWLRESLDRRNPYVDPLNLLQVRLLDRADRSPIEEQTLRLTVKGIAAGMQSTG
jgi:phosphoenolpyruvate carboxylase